MSASLGPERFLREIEVAAQLHHPHILPQYDPGDVDGFLFYVMPYEEGQCLRERLQKETELPIQNVVRPPRINPSSNLLGTCQIAAGPGADSVPTR